MSSQSVSDVARTRVMRTLAVAFAVGAIVFGALQAPSIVAQSRVFAP